MLKKCETCLKSRPIVSENGIHKVCSLSQRAAMNCIMGKKNNYATLSKDNSKRSDI